MTIVDIKIIVDFLLFALWFYLVWKCKEYLQLMKDRADSLKSTNDMLTYHIMNQIQKQSIEREDYELAAKAKAVIDALDNPHEFIITVTPAKPTTND